MFTRFGYMEATGGDFQEVYVPGEMAYFMRSDAPVELTVSKGIFNDPDYDNNMVASLDLPAAREMIDNAIYR